MIDVIKKVLKTIVNILIFIVFGVLALIIAAKINMLINGQKHLELFGYSTFIVATGSMEPTLKQNDLVIVKKSDTYKKNDIITFEKDGNFITHRIINFIGEDIITKGDANNTNDAAIKESLIIGKVIKVYKNAGIWQKILTKPTVIIMIFVTLILFDFAFSYKGFNNKKENEKEVKEEKIIVKEIVKEPIKVEEVKLKESDKRFDYTIGINLNEIQSKINKKMKEEK